MRRRGWYLVGWGRHIVEKGTLAFCKLVVSCQGLVVKAFELSKPIRRPIGGELATSDEMSEVGYFSPDEIDGMDIHPSIRLRIQHFLEKRPEPYLG